MGSVTAMPLFLKFVISICLLAACQAQAKTITLIADEWCPYSCPEQHYREGIGVDIARMIFENKGYKVIYKTATWVDAIQQVKQGQADVLIGALKSEVPGMLFPGYPFSNSNTCFISRPDIAKQYSSLESIKNKPIGVINGYDYEEPLDQYLKQASAKFIIKYPDINQLYKALIQKDIDVFIEDDKVANYYSGKNDYVLGRDYSIASCHVSGGVYFAVAPDNSDKTFEILKTLDRGLHRALKNGSIKQIHTKYGFDADKAKPVAINFVK